MRLMIAILVVALLAIVDFARYHGQHTGQVLDLWNITRGKSCINRHWPPDDDYRLKPRAVAAAFHYSFRAPQAQAGARRAGLADRLLVIADEGVD